MQIRVKQIQQTACMTYTLKVREVMHTKGGRDVNHVIMSTGQDREMWPFENTDHE